jgi:hypothetical protein
MNGISSEVLSILFFAAIVLGQLIMQQYRKRQAAKAPPPGVVPDDEMFMADDDDDLEGPGFDAPPRPHSPPVRHAHTHVASRHAQQHAAPRTIRRYSRRALLGSQRRVQDAVVVAAILGRCRAFEPHDSER